MKTILFNNNNILEYVCGKNTFCNQCYFEHADCRIDANKPTSMENRLCNLVKENSFSVTSPHPVFKKITELL